MRKCYVFGLLKELSQLMKIAEAVKASGYGAVIVVLMKSSDESEIERKTFNAGFPMYFFPWYSTTETHFMFAEGIVRKEGPVETAIFAGHRHDPVIAHMRNKIVGCFELAPNFCFLTRGREWAETLGQEGMTVEFRQVLPFFLG